LHDVVPTNFDAADFQTLNHTMTQKNKSIAPSIEMQKRFLISLMTLGLLLIRIVSSAQETQIRGFADFGTNYSNEQVNFTLGEQDLFITSDVSDRLSFLGETVFKYVATSPTRFDISIERIIMKYNIKGNHNILFGKHHTPVNYWNDSYHHGRVLFPTIFRPEMFGKGVVPLHTTGIRFQGQNLGKLRFGYDALIGNGGASTDAIDFNKKKSVMLGVNMTPIDRFRVGLTYYHDNVPAQTVQHHTTNIAKKDIDQSLYSASVSYFGNKFELLAEGSVGMNAYNDTLVDGAITEVNPVSPAGYLYAGYRIKQKFVPYVRVDVLEFDHEEMLFSNNTQRGALFGLRYEINYLAVVKLEYAYMETSHEDVQLSHTNTLNFQFAIGF
jgi:hypothetical protein